MLTIDSLKKRLTDKLEDFFAIPQAEVIETPDGPLIYQDNGSNVLAVSHLDAVMFDKPRIRKTKRRGLVVECPQLDDRLGAWVILDLLPQLGVKCDILLTDGEECGRTTAAHFKPRKDYNWGFEFDRRGTDCVLYQYESSEDWRTDLERSGFYIGQGSFSDISKLDHLGVCFCNIGTGYHMEHSRQCYAELRDTLEQARTLAAFYRKHKDDKYNWEEPLPFCDYKSFDMFGVCPECGEDLFWNGFCELCGYEDVTRDDRIPF